MTWISTTYEDNLYCTRTSEAIGERTGRQMPVVETKTFRKSMGVGSIATWSCAAEFVKIWECTGLSIVSADAEYPSLGPSLHGVSYANGVYYV